VIDVRFLSDSLAPLMDTITPRHPQPAIPKPIHGQATKMEQVYRYLTGVKFRQRVEAVIEKFNDMREDLDRERRFMGKQWSKREAQILAGVDSTVGIVGDLQGIAGKAMPKIHGLDMPLLEVSIAAGNISHRD
jgi:hypothetical protein